MGANFAFVGSSIFYYRTQLDRTLRTEDGPKQGYINVKVISMELTRVSYKEEYIH